MRVASHESPKPTTLPYLWVLCAVVMCVCAGIAIGLWLGRDPDIGPMSLPVVGAAVFGMAAIFTFPVREPEGRGTVIDLRDHRPRM